MSSVSHISASSLDVLQSCSLRFYYKYIEKIPSSVHKKAVIGSLCHSLFEVLRNNRHRATYDLISADPFDYTRSSSIVRFINRWKLQHDIPDNLLSDINDLLRVGLSDINYFHVGATRVFEPEHEFLLDIGEGCQVKGFIDSMAEYPDKFIILDFKSSAQKFTAKDVSSNIQALIYQLYIWKTFGKPARVEFIMLRHPPTARTPAKHIQIVEPLTPDQLHGLEFYLRDSFKTMNSFGLQEAYSNPHKDTFFCDRVCSYRNPYDYIQITKKDGTPVKSYMLDKAPQSCNDDEILVKRRFAGCARWNQ